MTRRKNYKKHIKDLKELSKEVQEYFLKEGKPFLDLSQSFEISDTPKVHSSYMTYDTSMGQKYNYDYYKKSEIVFEDSGTLMKVHIKFLDDLYFVLTLTLLPKVFQKALSTSISIHTKKTLNSETKEKLSNAFFNARASVLWLVKELDLEEIGADKTHDT